MSIILTAPIQSDDVEFLNQQLQIEIAGNDRDRATIQNQARIIHTLQEIIRAYQEQNERLLKALGTHDWTQTMQEFCTWSNAHEAMRRCDEQIETIRDYTEDDLGI